MAAVTLFAVDVGYDSQKGVCKQMATKDTTD